MNCFVLSHVAASSIAGSASAQKPVWDANTVVLESPELAEGVFSVIPAGADEIAENGAPVATSSGFVIGDDSVLVIDTMLNAGLHSQIFGLIRTGTGLPVRYGLNTSFHGNHACGNQYLPDETLIIQHNITPEFISEQLEADQAFMIQNSGEGRGIEDITAPPAELSVADQGEIEVDPGGIAVTIRDYGFARTDGDLFVSVPSGNILWTGNPVIAEAPAPPWLLDGHLTETGDALQATLSDVDAETRIVPGHGPVTDLSAIQWSIDYLTAVKTEVRAAVSEGPSPAETVAQLLQPEYQGYALFGWVHPGLNVTAAYKQLQ